MRSNLASRRSASLDEEAWLICATSSAVKMPFDCRTRTSGLTLELSAGCCAQLGAPKARITKQTTTQNGFLFIANTPCDQRMPVHSSDVEDPETPRSYTRRWPLSRTPNRRAEIWQQTISAKSGRKLGARSEGPQSQALDPSDRRLLAFRHRSESFLAINATGPRLFTEDPDFSTTCTNLGHAQE